jgi:hypothetical protein
MPTLRLTDTEFRWLHDHMRLTLPQLDDPEIVPAVNLFSKLAKGVRVAFCQDCWKPEVYARLRCQACWKRERRENGGRLRG